MKFDVIRKKFEFSINIKNRYWKKKFLLQYEQATMYEINEFLYESSKTNFYIANWVIDFVERYGNVKLNRRQTISIIWSYEEIFENLKQTYFKGAFDDESEGEWEWFSNDIIASYIVFLSSEFKQDPLYLMKNYTIEQLKFFTDWLVRNANEKTPEWKRKNRLKKIWANSENIDRQWVLNLLQKIDTEKCNEA